MPYFNLMSAINLYVAVDWQGDREIERAGGRLQRETRSGGRERVRDAKVEKERNPELQRTKWWRREERGNNVREREKEGEYTQTTDTPSFLLIEIQFERSKPGNSEEIELSRYYRERTVSTRCFVLYTPSRVLYIKPRICNECAKDRDVSRIIENSGKLHVLRIYTSRTETPPFSTHIIRSISYKTRDL